MTEKSYIVSSEIKDSDSYLYIGIDDRSVEDVRLHEFGTSRLFSIILF